MIGLWNRLMNRLRRPSSATIEAQERLAATRRDDDRVNDVIQRQQQIIKENHLGPLIASLFERSHRHQ